MSDLKKQVWAAVNAVEGSNRVLTEAAVLEQLGHMQSGRHQHKEGAKRKAVRYVLDKKRKAAPTPPAAPSVDSKPTSEPDTDTEKPTPKRRRMRKAAHGAGDGLPDTTAAALTPTPIPSLRLEDVGGVEAHLGDLMSHVFLPLLGPQVLTGTEPPHGLLLHGPAGCGKTMLANAIVGHLGDVVHYQALAAPEVVSGVSGESEKRLRQVFDNAKRNAPAVIFIDEIDAIAGKRDASQRGMDKRIVAQLLSCMDGLKVKGTDDKAVIVIAATTYPDALDSALRSNGRFNRELCMGIPDEPTRAAILAVQTSKMNTEPGFDVEAVARFTPGYVGADLAALANEAAISCANRLLDTIVGPPPAPSTAPTAAAGAGGAPPKPASTPWQDFSTALDVLRSPEGLPPDTLAAMVVTMGDFEEAAKRVQPTATREGFATIPDVSWADVGALDKLRGDLRECIVRPIKNPRLYEGYGLAGVRASGVLLFGPPGCGKTLLAKAIANESRANFISVKGPELLDKYVGESERAVRQVFQRAQASAPCIVFFDELDALAPRRGVDGSGSGVSERVVNQLLTELDGIGARGDVHVVGATNRPDIIDKALLRQGRLGKLFYVPLPTPEDRVAILATHVRKLPTTLTPEDIKAVADRCASFSGADLAGLAREAALQAMRRVPDGAPRDFVPSPVSREDLEAALGRVEPSVSPSDLRHYSSLQATLRV